MKTKLLFIKKRSNTFYGLLVFCLCLNYGWSQQVIGQFPEMDGGLEGQTAGDMSSAGSGQIDTAQTEWTVSSTGNSGTRSISNVPADARSGSFSAGWSVLATKTNVRLQSPSPTSPLILINTEYTVQYFYKTGDIDPGDDLDPGIYLNNTSGGNTTNKTDVTAWVINTWTKTYGTVTTGADFNASNWAVARISTIASGGYNSTVNVDDFVVYAGTYDDTAPSAATAGTYDVSGNVGWTAPAAGVDSGGYLVLRYTSSPAADNDPNQNGIYQVGNTTTNGTGGLTGTVAYIGTATTFNETYVAGTYYKIYSVDKAFNYSDELMVSDATLGVAKNKMLEFNVYPNPAMDFITIHSASVKISSVEIYSLLGQRVLSQSVLKDNKINVASLSRGLYVLKIAADGNSISKKIVIE